MTQGITPGGGPVAVTGAAGFIGSHIVRTLVRRGYEVRACVRDPDKTANVAHLSIIGREGPGQVSLFAADMTIDGAYDQVFDGCAGVFHAAAEMGNLEGSTPLKVYQGGIEATRGVAASISRAGTVRRLIYTSSFAAVAHPAPEGHRFTEASWADMSAEMRPVGARWDQEGVRRNREVAYATTKVESERFVYAAGAEGGFTAIGICPVHVIGPLLSASHQRPWTWQTRIGDLAGGCSQPRMFWNIVDVRDVTAAQVRAAEADGVCNGERFILGASDERDLITQSELQAHLRRLYPGYGVAGDYRPGRLWRSPIATSDKAMRELGLEPQTLDDTIRDNVDSLLAWGLVTLRPGEDNWQREGVELGLTSSFNPHVYPASDPEQQPVAAPV